MTFDKMINGLGRYIEREIYPHMNDWQEVLARVAVARMLGERERLKALVRGNPLISTLIPMKDNGEIELEALRNELRAQIAKKEKVTIELPLFGKYHFTAGDIDKLYAMMQEG